METCAIDDILEGVPVWEDVDCFIDKSPVYIKETVTYIVGGVILEGESPHLSVVLVQEAKPSCRAKWYLPCGRLEPGESLVEGCMREVKEEANVDVHVESLTCVQVQGGGWYRFIFMCSITGGNMKTTQQADSESLQAQAFPLNDVLDRKIDLRSKDILPLLRAAACLYGCVRPTLPRPIAVPSMYVRLLIVKVHNGQQNTVELVARKKDGGLPLVEYSLTTFVPVAVSKLYRELFVDGASDLLLPEKVVHVNCQPVPAREHDGLCLTLLCLCKPNRKPRFNKCHNYEWVQQINCSEAILRRMISHAPLFHMI